MKRKVRKYVEGGYGDSYSEDFGMGSREEMIERNIEENERRRQAEQLKPSTTLAEFEEPGTAGFSRSSVAPTPVARKAVAPAPRPKPVAPKPATQPTAQTSGSMGRTAMGKTVAQEMAAIEAGRTAAGKADLERRKAYDKPLERVTPESNLIGGVPLRGAKALATGAKEFASYVKQKMGKGATTGATKQLGQSGSKAENLTKDMGPVEYATQANKRRQLASDTKGKGVIQSGAADRYKTKPSSPPRGGGKDPGARRPTQDELDEMRMGSDYMRKGGKVGSASKRADGIATRGKTRGRYI
jgi:hypothetical protein